MEVVRIFHILLSGLVTASHLAPSFSLEGLTSLVASQVYHLGFVEVVFVEETTARKDASLLLHLRKEIQSNLKACFVTTLEGFLKVTGMDVGQPPSEP